MLTKNYKKTTSRKTKQKTKNKKKPKKLTEKQKQQKWNVKSTLEKYQKNEPAAQNLIKNKQKKLNKIL